MMLKINQMSKENGFTLIELIIVIVILGILAAVGIPRFLNNKKEAWTNSCKANRATLDDAGERYHFENSAWPADQAALVNGLFIKNYFACPAGTATNTYNFANASTGVTCSNTGGAHD
jgi:type IV pilus assembly protein PilA